MEDLKKFIVFKLNEQSFGIDVQQILSIERLQKITSIPKSPKFLKGIINLRDRNIPIIDLKEKLSINQTLISDNNRILIVNIDNDQVGFLVDEATDVIDIDKNEIEPAPTIGGDIKEEFIEGVVKLEDNLLVLLDLKRILDLNVSKEI